MSNEPDDIMGPVARLNRRKSDTRPIGPVSDAWKLSIVERTKNGEFLTDICSEKKAPTYSSVMKAFAADENFRTAFKDALEELANAVLSDAADYQRQSAELGDLDAMRKADIYTRSITAVIEKLTPKTHGNLLKLSDNEGGPLTVQVVNYANQAKAKEAVKRD